MEKMKDKEAASKGILVDIELSMERNDLTMIIQYKNRSHRITISPKEARNLSNKLAKAADFLDKPDVVS